MTFNFMQYYNPEERSFETFPSRGDPDGIPDSGGPPSGSALSAVPHSASTRSSHEFLSVDNTGQETSKEPSKSSTIVMPLDQMRNGDNLELMFADTHPRSPVVGRGRHLEERRMQPARRGKGRAVTQGAVIPIANNIREKALAETRLKRARRDVSASLEDAEEMNFDNDSSRASTISVHPNGRGIYSCDQCYYRKTKVPVPPAKNLLILQCHRKVDGKPPSEQFPCDYCSSINLICSTYVADAKKPESFMVSMEQNYKRRRFPLILNDAIEQENFALRQRLGNLEEKLQLQNKVHDSVLRQLEAMERQNRLLEKANTQATETWETACNLMKKLSVSGGDKESEMDSDLSASKRMAPGVALQNHGRMVSLSDHLPSHTPFSDATSTPIHGLSQGGEHQQRSLGSYSIAPRMNRSLTSFRAGYFGPPRERFNTSTKFGICSGRSRICCAEQRGQTTGSFSP